MNWQQLYTTLTPAEREELLITMFRTLEARHNRKVFVRGRLLQNRRRGDIAHFIGDRRLLHTQRRHKNRWTAALAVTSIIGWVLSVALQPAYGAALVILIDLMLITVLLVKPYLRLQPARLIAKNYPAHLKRN